MIRVLHVTSSLSRLGGGISPVVWELARHQARWGALTQVAGLLDSHTAEDAAGSQVPFYAARLRGPAAFGFSPDLRRHFAASTALVDLIHSHGLWMYPGWEARRLALARGVPLVVSPHGMLEPWAMHRSRLKKTVAAWLFENENLRAARCVHALCEAEAQHVRQLGIAAPVAVVPNGIDLDDAAPRPDRDAIAARFPSLRGRRRALFLSRIHPKKGLPNLLEAWAELGKLADGWTLIVAGPDQGGHAAAMWTLAASLGIERRVLFTGPLYGEAKREALAGADFFVLPSFSEGFSMAVLEAAASRLPVLLTRGCNFPELAAAGAAMEVSAYMEDVWRGLRKLITMPDAQRVDMGARARLLVESRFTWNAVAAAMMGVYAWLLNGGPTPECIR